MIDFGKLREKVKNKPALGKEEFLQIVSNLQNEYNQIMEKDDRVATVGKIYKPKEVARYDIVSSYVCGTVHPALVFKTDAEYVYAVSLSSTQADHNIFKFEKSRMFGGNYMTNTIIRYKKAEGLALFVGIFDHKAEADTALMKLRNLYKNIFKL